MEVVAYAYQADLWCPECIAERVYYDLETKLNVITFMQQPWETTEEYLGRVQGFFGIRDRYKEDMFDSNDFPKVIFDSDIEEGDTCDNCSTLLSGE